ncbi:transcriptional regulator [Bacillus thuringiensis]|uniref:helix-turn-helix domain-containing protein n=1 Tax=Bacillus cereus group TaxID=86661 RepID=UPI0006A84A24|nr:MULTISPECIES: helix-turn-helix transcriptional regulator [Bacillus cereus group]PEF05048.1 transcriptional regulator [Bacillus thuringiensis]PFI26431.1 transcriptional regulator [Bacillus thuringiensis]PFP73045.1 transcriptional regulator [Bacillus thuringiensis]PGE40405.1 transcriptional regulator [Bacillus cereus]PGQ51222.1 transcriptional regulator [Bacillus thuringiensis]
MENITNLDVMLSGKTIRFLRTLRNISCEELAEISNVKQANIYKFEVGRRKVTRLANYRITKALLDLGFSLDEILVINLFVNQKERDDFTYVHKTT